MTLESLMQAQKAARERILLTEMGVKFHKFGGLTFYDGMSFYDQSEAQLVLAHAYLHKSHSMKNSDLDKQTIEKLHSKLIVEFKKRNLPHEQFDKLDTNLT